MQGLCHQKAKEGGPLDLGWHPWGWGVESESCSVMCDSLQPHGLQGPWNSSGQDTRVGSCSLLQKIFPTHGLNPGLPHCRRILYQLSQQGSPRILEWVAYPFSSVFLTQESNWGLLHCRCILYQLSYQRGQNGFGDCG